MNIRMQLIRAAAALAIIGGVATAETVAPVASAEDCPFAKTAKPQRILLLDPVQKHPIMIDARIDTTRDATLHATAAHIVTDDTAVTL
jgi:hypothetical protein